MFFKIERWNFQVQFEIGFRETSQNFNSIKTMNCNGLKNISFRTKTFMFSKIESWNFQHLFWNWILRNLTKFQLNQTIDKKNENNNCLNELCAFVKFHEILYKQMLKVSAIYLEKQKSFIPKKIFFWPYSLNMPR